MTQVWVGLVGTVLVAWAACGTYWSYDPSGWAQPVVAALGDAVPHEVSRVLMVVGFALLCWAWWTLRPRDGVPQRHGAWTVLAVWAAPLLLVPPVLTADPFAYADSGWLFLHGQNPYAVGYGAIGGPFAASVDPLWRGVGVAYPPLQFLLNAAIVGLTGAHPYWSVVALRLPALAGVALLAACLPRCARLLGLPPAAATWLGVLNPLVVVHFLGGAHNDAVMVGVSVLAVWVTLRARGTRHAAWWHLLVAPAIVGVAMALKQQAGLTVIAVAGLPVAGALTAATAGRRVWLWAWRLTVVTAVAVGVFVVVSVVTGLGFGWVEWMDQMGRTGSAAPFNLLGQLVSIVAPDIGIYRILGVVSTVCMLGVLVLFFVRFVDAPLRWLGWGALWFTILGSALHPWYVVWPLALLALTPLRIRSRMALVVFVVAFGLWNALQTVLFASAPL
ncbi:polyprenol phosphomannose-dependent alpha 1,6 mannosyltransferase MptB [Propionicicella superfundia]|uniref:polyprenol phosphomannose-dependent alpha 1,6 mannosyltransferase MptB n=1 Tax=Propionicicella superfundia TaxID=348582 RepID=UPI0003F7474B|nr:polyprenol phosphomannose-dependent alpha 1,6 mannosyltransferase MptB [Propionicicella superfundia]